MLYNLYLWIYHWPPMLLLFVLALIGCAWSAFMEHVAARNKKTVITCNVILLTIFILLILYTTVFDRSGRGDVIIYLRPFHTFSAAKLQPELYRSTCMNVALFYPLGLTLGCICKRKSWRIAILAICAAALFSVFIECYQYIERLGECDIDDVIFNTLGAVIGYGVSMSGIPLYHLILSNHEKRHKHS